MKITSRINFLHLLLTIFVTIICVVPTFIILLLALSAYINDLYTNEWNYFLKVFILATIVFAIALTILLKKTTKSKTIDQRKSNSFKIASVFLVLLFFGYARFPLHKILTLNPAGKTPMEQFNDEGNTVRQFLKENNATDSLTSKQIDKLVDTLGTGWKRTDTLKKH